MIGVPKKPFCIGDTYRTKLDHENALSLTDSSATEDGWLSHDA